MKFFKTDFKDLIIIKHNIYSDKEGFFKENFKNAKFEQFMNKNSIFVSKIV